VSHKYIMVKGSKDAKIAELRELVRVKDEALLHLKHNSHHSIEEEMWDIDKALEAYESRGKV